MKYAKISCSSLSPSFSVFCLKRNHHNLTSQEYAANLISFLNTARCCSSVTNDNFRNTLNGIVGRIIGNNLTKNTETIHSSIHRNQNQKYSTGEHVIAYFTEDDVLLWRLGIIEIVETDNLMVSFMTAINTERNIWEFDQEETLLGVSYEQIFASSTNVKYFNSRIIHLKIFV